MAARITQGEIREDETRYTAVLDDVEGGAHDDGRDPAGFQMSCDQTHGLVADWSKRGQNRGIGFVVPEAPQDFRRVLFRCLLLTVTCGRGVKAHCDRAQSPIGD